MKTSMRPTNLLAITLFNAEKAYYT